MKIYNKLKYKCREILVNNTSKTTSVISRNLENVLDEKYNSMIKYLKMKDILKEDYFTKAIKEDERLETSIVKEYKISIEHIKNGMF